MYVLFEGVDTCGKSTQVALFAQRHPDVLTTKEPGGTPLGMRLRALLLEAKEPLSTHAELLLFLADRAEHYAKVIKPERDRRTIISDRGFLSGIAYALANHPELHPAFLRTLNRFVLEDHLPQKVVLFITDEALIRERMARKGEDAIESRGVAYLLQIQAIMQAQLKDLCIETLEVDARCEIETLYTRIEDFIYD